MGCVCAFGGGGVSRGLLSEDGRMSIRAPTIPTQTIAYDKILVDEEDKSIWLLVDMRVWISTRTSTRVPKETSLVYPIDTLFPLAHLWEEKMESSLSRYNPPRSTPSDAFRTQVPNKTPTHSARVREPLTNTLTLGRN
jgi:hypothetical protein